MILMSFFLKNNDIKVKFKISHVEISHTILVSSTLENTILEFLSIHITLMPLENVLFIKNHYCTISHLS